MRNDYSNSAEFWESALYYVAFYTQNILQLPKSNTMRKLLAISLVFLFCNCVDVSTEPNWANYSPEVKSRIDNASCNDLQKEFNTAESNSDRQRARTGEGNSLLMGYIDGKMREKGCY